MEDALTDAPPPSRFLQEDLNNFTPPSPTLPSPFLLFSNPNNNQPPPSLLIVAISSPSLYLLHHYVPSKSLIGTLILPETYFSGNSIKPSLKDKTCNIYALHNNGNYQSLSILLVCVQCPVSAERSHTVAKTLMEIRPERVLILDSIQSRNFRGRLSPDEAFAFKLETCLEQKEGPESRMIECSVDYFPTGSVIDGLAAAILGRCEIEKIRGTLCVSWPEYDVSAVSLLKSLLMKGVFSSSKLLDLSVDEEGDYNVGFNRIRDSRLDNELYT